MKHRSSSSKNRLQHTESADRRERLSKSSGEALAEQLDLPSQEDSAASLRIKKELHRRKILMRCVLGVFLLFAFLAVFFLIRSVVMNTSYEQSLSFPISTQDDAPLDIRLCGERVAVTDSGEVSFYSSDASSCISLQHGCSKPVSVGAGKYVLTFDQGGTTAKLDNMQKNLYTVSTDNESSTILFGAVQEDGAFAIAATESRYKGSVSIYNKNGSQIYKWSSSEHYVMAGAFVSSSEMIVAAVDVENADYVTYLYRLRTDRDQEELIAALPNVLPLQLCVKGGNIQVVAETGVYTVDSKGNSLNTYTFEGRLCAVGGLESSGSLCVAALDATDPNASRIAILSSAGAVQAQADIDQAVADIFSSSDGLVYLTGTEIVLTDSSLNVQQRYENDRSFTQAVRLGESCYAIGSDVFDCLSPQEDAD